MLQPLANAWYTVQVKPRTEKKVASELEEKGYEKFLPTYVSRRKWSDRVKMIEVPLFPGYVFCRLRTIAGGRIVSTPGVIRLISSGGRPCLTPDSEIADIRKVAQFGNPEPAAYCVTGERVLIKQGPLAGVVGIVIRVRNDCRLIVSVGSINRSVSVVVEQSAVSACSSQRIPQFLPAAV